MTRQPNSTVLQDNLALQYCKTT